MKEGDKVSPESEMVATTTGVVIMRAQIDELHAGHRSLIDYAIAENDQVLVFVGYNDVRCMPGNPLSVTQRIRMISDAYPGKIVVQPLPDSKESDPIIGNRNWSLSVDAVIQGYVSNAAVTLYGGRDSFIPAYSGVYKTKELPEVPGISATAIRKRLTAESIVTKEQRQGWIACIYNQYPVMDNVCDTALVSKDWQRVWLGRRTENGVPGFNGGFQDASDVSDEQTAERENHEEVAGVERGEAIYIGSVLVDSPRYRPSKGKCQMRSRLFAFECLSGTPKGADDMPFGAWYPLTVETREVIKVIHRDMFDLLLVHKQRHYGSWWRRLVTRLHRFITQ